jgi:hypothetical protein
MATVEDIEQDFRIMANRLISLTGPGLTDEVSTWIRRGAERMQSEGCLDNKYKIILARDNFQKMVHRAEQNVIPLVQEARSLDPDEVRQAVIEDAFRGLCPIWPFC